MDLIGTTEAGVAVKHLLERLDRPETKRKLVFKTRSIRLQTNYEHINSQLNKRNTNRGRHTKRFRVRCEMFGSWEENESGARSIYGWICEIGVHSK